MHSGAVLGDAPQDLSYRGAKSYLRIGDRNVFREGVQVHRGTAPESTTVIGDDNFLMANSHVAHNCRVGNHIILTNNAVLGGYVEVGDRAVLSASCAVHQFVRVGKIAIMRGMSATSRDVPPFSIIDWQHTVRGLNVVGLRRAGSTSPGSAPSRTPSNSCSASAATSVPRSRSWKRTLKTPPATSPSCSISSAHRNAGCAPAPSPIRPEDPEEAPLPSFPRKRESRGGEGYYSGGVSPPHPSWIPACAGMTGSGPWRQYSL